MPLHEVWSARTTNRERVADCVRLHEDVLGMPPTVREIVDALDLSVGLVTYHLERLVTAGALERMQARTSRSVRSVRKAAHA